MIAEIANLSGLKKFKLYVGNIFINIYLIFQDDTNITNETLSNLAASLK
jgi:hypothetical protein